MSDTASSAVFDAKADLYTALAAAQFGVHSLGKDGRNEYTKYDYTTSESLIDAARKAMAPHGLSVVRSSFDAADTRPEFEVRSVFRLLHSSGQSDQFTSTWIAAIGKGRPADKALAGALTTSLAYFLRDLLLIPRQDESEADRRNDQNWQPQQRQQQQQQRQQPPPQQRQQNDSPSKPPKPALTELKFSGACIELGLDREMVVAWRDEAKPADKGKWNDFRRGGIIAKLRGYPSKMAAAASIEPRGPAAWAMFNTLTDGKAAEVAGERELADNAHAQLLEWAAELAK